MKFNNGINKTRILNFKDHVIKAKSSQELRSQN